MQREYCTACVLSLHRMCSGMTAEQPRLVKPK
jgi:hypothetical protein